MTAAQWSPAMTDWTTNPKSSRAVTRSSPNVSDRGGEVGGADLADDAAVVVDDVLDRREPAVDCHQQALLDRDVAVGEVDDLGALGGDRDAVGSHVELTVGDRLDHRLPGEGLGSRARS